MYRENEHRWLAAVLAATALFAESIAGSAQPPRQSTTAVSLPGPAFGQAQFQPNQEQIGDSMLSHQRYQAAIEAYAKSPRDTAAVWNKMGVANQLMFNTDEAVRCYQKAAKLDPKNASVLNNLGSTYVTLKQYSAAERSYHKALKLEPKTAIFLKNLGTALLAEHKYKKGWEAYKAALAIDPEIFDHSASYRVQSPSSLQDRGAMNYYMAKGCVRAGMNEKAIEYLRLALNEGFTNPRKIVADSEFAGLRDVLAFQQLLAAQRTP